VGPLSTHRSLIVPFSDEIAGAVERTDGAGPPRRGWLGGAGPSMGAPGGRVAGLVWFLSRHGRYGRAVMLHQHLRERRAAGSRSGRRARRGLLADARRFDAAAVRRRTVWAAVRWARLTGRLSRHRPGREAVVGAVAAHLALPAVVAAAAGVAVLLLVDVSVRALFAVGGSVRAAVVEPPTEVAPPAPPSFDWTPS
jgi:hypothetical protein